MKRTCALAALASLALLGAPARADDAPKPERPRSSFRIDYALFEVESGKRANERAFTLTVNEGSHGQLRSGTRVPITVGDKGVQYMDVGLKLSGRVLEREGDVTFEGEIEMSTFALPEQATEGKGNPVVRTVTETVSTRPVLGKPAVVSSLDDLNSRKRLQVEVTVTRLK
jgi:hypothetical protein